jgi:hypothetical protein
MSIFFLLYLFIYLFIIFFWGGGGSCGDEINKTSCTYGIVFLLKCPPDLLNCVSLSVG